MGDYVDWDYSESIGGVPASLIAYSGSAPRKRRGALTGFDTTYATSDDASITALQAKIDKLQTQLTQTQTITQQYLATQQVNYIINGNFLQWSGPQGLRSATLGGAATTWKLSGTCVPCADKWYTFGDTSAFTGLTSSVRVECLSWQPAISKSALPASNFKSTDALQIDWSTTGTVQLYGGGDNKDKSTAVLGVQQLIPDITKWQNRQLTLDFWLSSTVQMSAFIQVSRQYNLNRPTIDLTNMRVFSNSLKPPGLEVIFRDQISLQTGWQRVQRTFDLGALLGTTLGPDGEHGLLIQIGPLYYINTKDSSGSTVIQKWGDAGGLSGLLKIGGGTVTWDLADVMMYDGPYNANAVFPLRDESTLTLPWVNYYGPRYLSEKPKGDFIIDSGTTDPENQYNVVCRMPFQTRMARPPSNVIIGYTDSSTEADAANIHLTRDYLYGSMGPGPQSGIESRYRGVAVNGRTRFVFGMKGFAGRAAWYEHNHASGPNTTKWDTSAFPGQIDADNATNGSQCVIFQDSNKQHATISMNPMWYNSTLGSANGRMLFGQIYSAASAVNSTLRGWIAFYARDTDWGSTNPTETVNFFDQSNVALTSICFPLTTIN